MFANPKHAKLLAVGLCAGAVLVAGCAGDSESGGTSNQADGATVSVQDNHGTVEVPVPPQRVVATDNRSFRTLAQWDVQLVAAPRALMDEANPYRADESITDIGNHREPDMEAFVAADPDVVINGQRFAQYYQEIKGLVPNAAIVELDPREGQPFDAELKRQTTGLGEVFGKQAEAQALSGELDASVTRAKAAYNPEQKVMGLLTSGGEISYSAPSTGRSLGPVFDVLGLTPALEVAGEDTSHGDDISVEAIADANPDWILVLDRDAPLQANSDEAYTPAQQLISESEALQNVTAVQRGQIVYMPADTYLNEDIFTYTQFFNDIADAMEQAGQG